MPFKITTEIRAELRDRQGKLIRRLPWKPANSLLKQFIQLLTVQMQQAAVTIKDTTNTDRSVTTHAVNFAAQPPAGNTAYGTLIGTGTNPVTMADYKLQTQVSTNIAHAAPTFAIESPDANTWRLAIARVFTNNTGASLGIREVAIYAMGTAGAYYLCVDRSLYSVDVPNGIGVTLTYRITVTL